MGCLLWLYRFLNFLLFFHLYFLATCSSSSPQLCPHDQSSALLKFKNSFTINSSASSDCDDNGIASYPKTNSWNESRDCCSWDGVMCDSMTGHVIGLDLSCSRLFGPISTNNSLFLLSHLKILNLASNDFENSRISSQFGWFAGLTYLNLSNSLFFGQVPYEISHLSRLITLDLSSNFGLGLSLERPTLKGIVQNLTKVRELFLDGINMSSVALGCLMNLSSSLTSLSLSDCQLQGNFPSNIFYRPKLQWLRLNSNHNLSGHFPKSNWSGPLELLDISDTPFCRESSDSIGNLKSLKYLSLFNCNITGSIPSSLNNLEQLTDLDLSYNNFAGSFPDAFGCRLSNLVTLYINNNLLNGTIPSCLYTLPSLQVIDLSNNQLIGDINEFQSKSFINLANNKLHGPFPSSIFELVNLEFLFLFSNNLSGIVEIDKFSKLKNLIYLDLSYNSLSLVSTNIHINYTLPNLDSLFFSSCNIIEFPYFLQALKNLRNLNLSNNKIFGQIPEWMWDVGKDSLSFLNLSHNLLTGIEKFPWKNLDTLDLRSNMLKGPLLIPPPTIKFFSISNNSLTGELSSLICNSSSLEILDISHNNLSGIIPPCLGNLSKTLSVLNMQKNNFHGTIPIAFSKDCGLQNLNLNENQLGGKLPRSMVNCRDLEVVDLGNNKINDTFPYWFGDLPELQVLVLRSNKFHSYVHGSRTHHSFYKLRIFDISNNYFVGPLPIKYIKNFEAMINVSEGKSASQYMSREVTSQASYDYSVSIIMKGFVFDLVKILTIFTSFDLSNNSFEGEIPEVIGKLNSLKGLNLSHNKLGGHIPPTMGNLTNLEWLDLSSNKLVGEIPMQLVDLTSLAILNVSHNQLVGSIPQGKQFNTFKNDSYVGNSRLCGFPLTKTCSNVEPKQPPELIFHNNDDSHYAYEFGWKVVLMGYGCGMVFGMAMGYLVFRIGKPKWFVMLVEGEQHQKKKRSKKNASRSGIRN